MWIVTLSLAAAFVAAGAALAALLRTQTKHTTATSADLAKAYRKALGEPMRPDITYIGPCFCGTLVVYHAEGPIVCTSCSKRKEIAHGTHD